MCPPSFARIVEIMSVGSKFPALEGQPMGYPSILVKLTETNVILQYGFMMLKIESDCEIIGRPPVLEIFQGLRI